MGAKLLPGRENKKIKLNTIANRLVKYSRCLVGLNECSGVLEALRGYLGVLKQNISVQNVQHLSGGSDNFGPS